jgi:hypothetical protein
VEEEERIANGVRESLEFVFVVATHPTKDADAGTMGRFESELSEKC